MEIVGHYSQEQLDDSFRNHPSFRGKSLEERLRLLAPPEVSEIAEVARHLSNISESVIQMRETRLENSSATWLRILERTLNHNPAAYSVEEPFRSILIQKEAVLGGQLFGETSRGIEARFYCEDKHTWALEEISVDTHKIISFETGMDSILKNQDEQTQPVSQKEANGLLVIAAQYQKMVSELYEQAEEQ